MVSNWECQRGEKFLKYLHEWGDIWSDSLKYFWHVYFKNDSLNKKISVRRLAQVFHRLLVYHSFFMSMKKLNYEKKPMKKNVIAF